jgi:Fe2+ transport system protein FeoA
MTTKLSNSTLWQLKSGESCLLVGFDDSLDPKYKERVSELGFRPKTKVSCLKSPSFGAPKVYQVSNSVFSLEESVASGIFTKPLL